MDIGKWKVVQWGDKNSWDIVDDNCNHIVADLLKEEAFVIVDAHNKAIEQIMRLAY